MRIQAPRGTEDVLPNQVATWQYLESVFARVSTQFGYGEIRTPVFEEVALFKRTAGEGSDIVSKEMYEFRDKGDREMALKPEGTAPAIRAAIEHNLCPVGTHARLFYSTACYRYGRPAKGRLRELHQFGAELMGATSAEADAEILELAYRFFDEIGLGNEPILINSIGREECRTRYASVILQYVSAYLQDVSTEIRSKIEKNPLGLLDTKDPKEKDAIQGIPSILDFLEDDSRERFTELQELLVEARVPFRVAPEVVRGLDYYTETVFEFEHSSLRGLSILGGGRYDELVKQLGGSPTPCVGFGIGVERVLLALDAQKKIKVAAAPKAFVVRANPEAGEATRELVRRLRALGLDVLVDIDSRSMKSQLRQADKSGAEYALIIGIDELAEGVVTVRKLSESEQTKLPLEEVQCGKFA
jgi:histidyl-tRNA synthetase